MCISSKTRIKSSHPKCEDFFYSKYCCRFAVHDLIIMNSNLKKNIKNINNGGCFILDLIHIFFGRAKNLNLVSTPVGTRFFHLKALIL